MPISGFHRVLSGFLVVSSKSSWIRSFVYLASQKLKPRFSSIPSHVNLWYIYELDLPEILAEMTRNQLQGRSKWWVLHLHLSSQIFWDLWLVLFHQFSIECYVEDLKLLMKTRVMVWEGSHFQALIQSRHHYKDWKASLEEPWMFCQMWICSHFSRISEMDWLK